MSDPGDDPEPLETVALLLVAGCTVALLGVFGDLLRFLDSFRSWHP